MILKADLHIHSCCSAQNMNTGLGKLYHKIAIDSHMTVEQILSVAGKKHLNVISITDHDTLFASLYAAHISPDYGLLAIPGMEITSAQGHILAYGISQPISPHLEIRPTVDLIHAQGGLAVAAHPFAPAGIFFLGRNQEILSAGILDGIEVVSVIGGYSPHTLGIAEQYHLTALASTDSRTLGAIGNVYTFIDTEKNDPSHILKAVRQQQTQPVWQHKKNRMAVIWDLLKTNYLGRRTKPAAA